MSELLFYGTADNEGRCVRSVDAKSYPDGTPLIGFPRVGAIVERILMRPKSMATFVAGLFWVDALVERGNPPPELILPFVPGARQDRLNDSGDFLFTAKSVAKMINARNFPRVTVVDPHSEVTPALIDRCRVIHAAECVNPPPNKYAAVIAPDGGAEKRAGAVARKLGVPLVHAWKTRSVIDGGITGFGVEDFTARTGSYVLLVDDICDGGGTFNGLASVLPPIPGGGYDLFTSHGIYSQGTAKLLTKFRHLYCIDSILGAPREGIIEIDVCSKLLKGESL